MKTVKLQNRPNLFALVDDEDFPRVSKRKWYLGSLGYVNSDGRLGEPLLHRFIMNAEQGQELDHRNRNKLDCRKENLRFCTRSENCRNRPVRRDNKAGASGICFGKRGVRAYIGTPPNRTWKNFPTVEEAMNWRKAEARKRFADFNPHEE